MNILGLISQLIGIKTLRLTFSKMIFWCMLSLEKGVLHKAQFLGHWIGDGMSWLDQEKVRASHGGLGDATHGAGTTILP